MRHSGCRVTNQSTSSCRRASVTPRPGARALVLLMAVAVGCGESSSQVPSAAGPQDTVLGRFGDGGVVSREELHRAAERMPPALRARFETPAGQREIARSLIDKKLLVNEARRRGIDRDPEIRRQVDELEERLIVQALLEAEEKTAPGPTDRELRAYYEQHKDELVEPAQARVARVLVKVSADASVPERERARRKAESLAARVAAGEPMSEVALEGDGHERSRGGDLGFVVNDRKSPELEQAAFSLLNAGDRSEVFSCPEGYAFVQLLKRREAEAVSFEQAQSELKNRIAPQSKRKLFDSLLSRLRREADARVEIPPP